MMCLMMPNYFDYFLLLKHTGLCPDFQELWMMTPGALPVLIPIGSKFSILQVAFGLLLFFPLSISLHLPLLKVT